VASRLGHVTPPEYRERPLQQWSTSGRTSGLTGRSTLLKALAGGMNEVIVNAHNGMRNLIPKLTAMFAFITGVTRLGA